MNEPFDDDALHTVTVLRPKPYVRRLDRKSVV